MLIQEASGMSDDAIHFMKSNSAASEKKVYRKPGIYKGQIKMAKGFDDPLDDFEGVA